MQQLVDTWYDPLFRFALCLSGDGEEACVLTLRTFAQWTRQHPENGHTSDARFWFFATLHREFLNMH